MCRQREHADETPGRVQHHEDQHVDSWHYGQEAGTWLGGNVEDRLKSQKQLPLPQSFGRSKCGSDIFILGSCNLCSQKSTPAQLALPPSGMVLRTRIVTALSGIVTGTIVGSMPSILLGKAQNPRGTAV